MSGTKAGGRKAAAKNLASDPDFYKKIGAVGGSRSTTGGFAHLSEKNPKRHAEISAKGGKNGRRT